MFSRSAGKVTKVLSKQSHSSSISSCPIILGPPSIIYSCCSQKKTLMINYCGPVSSELSHWFPLYPCIYQNIFSYTSFTFKIKYFNWKSSLIWISEVGVGAAPIPHGLRWDFNWTRISISTKTQVMWHSGI